MTTELHSLAFVTTREALGDNPRSEVELMRAVPADLSEGRFVTSASRRGVIHSLIRAVCQHRAGSKQIYLSEAYRLLEGELIRDALRELEAFMSEVSENPRVVAQAIEGAGLAQLCTEEDVLRSLQNASASLDPKPSWDDEGESLDYAFGLVKSHIQLLQRALRESEVFIYALFSEALEHEIAQRRCA